MDPVVWTFVKFVFQQIYREHAATLDRIETAQMESLQFLAALGGRVSQLEIATALVADLIRVVSVKGDSILAFAQTIQDLISGINTETDNIAARIDALVAQLQNGPTPEQQTAIISQFGEISSRLGVLGRDPNNPLPAAA